MLVALAAAVVAVVAASSALEHLLNGPDKLLQAELGQVAEGLVVNTEQRLSHLQTVLGIDPETKTKSGKK